MLLPDAAWPVPLGAVALSSGDVHVWRVPLTVSPLEDAERYATLSADERARADRFVALPARTQFIAARSSLRAILSRYTGRDAREIAFRLGPVGKPALAGDSGQSLLFNLSHSREMALVAVTRCGEIGVDIEHVRD